MLAVNITRQRHSDLDRELTTLSHINNISLICFFCLHRLRKLRQLLDTANPQRIASTMIISRVDYCNAVFAGQLTATLASLRRDHLNAAARLVIGLGVHDSVGKAMKSNRSTVTSLVPHCAQTLPHGACGRRWSRFLNVLSTSPRGFPYHLST